MVRSGPRNRAVGRVSSIKVVTRTLSSYPQLLIGPSEVLDQLTLRIRSTCSCNSGDWILTVKMVSGRVSNKGEATRNSCVRSGKESRCSVEGGGCSMMVTTSQRLQAVNLAHRYLPCRNSFWKRDSTLLAGSHQSLNALWVCNDNATRERASNAVLT